MPSPAPRKSATRRPGEYKAIAAYYDAEYEHLPYLKTDVAFLLSKMPRRGEQVLELAVGTGRAAIALAEAGHRVVGVDNDPAMLERATRKRDFAGVPADRLALAEGDARTYRHPRGAGKFDRVVILFNTLLAFATLEQLDAVMATCRYHLRRGGRLWIDVFNPNLPLLAEGRSYGLDPVTFYVPELDRTVSRTADLEDVGGSASQRRRVTFHYRWFDRGVERYSRRRFEMTWMMPRELTLLVERHGMRVGQMWGDHDGTPVREGSPRLICEAVRAP